jgi:hypothetical protein
VKTRTRFLLALFELLEHSSVPYCVLRNYENVYEDASSDVDIAVEPSHLAAFQQCLDAAAAASGCALIHQARFTNFSFVYRHPEGQFVRVDVETELRWRVFPVLAASSVIELRRKHGAFYIPHPSHESVILLLASVWRGYLKERYRERLAALNAEVADREELIRTLRACFGRIGPVLETAQESVRTTSPPPTLWGSAKRSIVLNAFSSTENIRALFGYLIEDLHRFWHRLKNPPGISVLYISVDGAPDETADLFKRMEFLFPVQKLGRHSLRLGPGQSDAARLSLKLRLRRLYTLFKGGIFLRHYQVSNEAEIPKVAGTISRFLYPSRAFFCAQTTSRFWIGHAETGFIAECPADAPAAPRHEELIRFMTSTLTHCRASSHPAGISPSFKAGLMEPNRAKSWTRLAAFLGRILSFPRLASIGLCLIFIGSISFLLIGRLKHQARAIANDTLPGLSYAGAANANLAHSFNRTLMLLFCDNPEQRGQLQSDIDRFSEKTSSLLDAYRGQIFSAEDQTLFDSLLQRRKEYLDVRQQTLALVQKDRSAALLLYQTELLPAYQHYKEAGDRLFDYNSHLGSSRGQAILALCSSTPFAFWGVGTCLFLSGFLIGLLRHASLVWVPLPVASLPAQNR